MPSSAQKLADEFDCDLYRLIRRAEALAAPAVKVRKKVWVEIVNDLAETRAKVRTLMDERRRRETC